MKEKAAVCSCGQQYVGLGRSAREVNGRCVEWILMHLFAGHAPQEATPDIVAPWPMRPSSLREGAQSGMSGTPRRRGGKKPGIES